MRRGRCFRPMRLRRSSRREDESEGGGDGRRLQGDPATAIERLDQATRRFAELMMDSPSPVRIGGKTMEAAGESIGEGPTAPHPFAKAQVF